MSDREYRACAEIELRSEADGKITLRGYAAVFNSLSQDLGGFVEIIRPGAFTRTLASGADVRGQMGFAHRPDPGTTRP